MQFVVEDVENLDESSLSTQVSVITLLVWKHPTMTYGLGAFLGMKSYQRWKIDRALKARKGEKHSTKRRKK